MMTRNAQPSLLIVGGGIVGLVLAVVALGHGYAVTLIARDAPDHTASGIAAGMVAPALEALGDADPVESFKRLQQAKSAWSDLHDLWPQIIKDWLAQDGQTPSLYVFDKANGADVMKRLVAMGAHFEYADDDQLAHLGFDPKAVNGVQLADDGLMEAGPVLAALRAQIVAQGGVWLTGHVAYISSTQAVLDTGESVEADAVIVAAGYAAHALAPHVPSLACLTPIKGHLLDVNGRGGDGVVRTRSGYFADYGAAAKFGATMQVGQDDLAIEPEVVALLKDVSQVMSVDITDAVPRTGIRAASPDGWPLIGRDEASGVYVSTAMRRNGYVFAPFAAQIVLALIEGESTPDDGLYRPDRF
ncbi:MAG: FAD-dependent oxidoreductase [Asticcacaulis sp.]